MRVGVWVLCALSALVASVLGQEQVDDVFVLKKPEFSSFLMRNKFVLVEFYAPWCGHCKQLEPEYAKAAKELHSRGLAKLAKVDATEETELAEQHEIQGFPTIKFFKEMIPMEYTGGRTAQDIVNWVIKKTGPPAVHIKTDADMTLLQAAEVAVLGLFKDQESEAAKAFLKVSDEMDAIAFGITSEAALFKKYGKDADAVIVLKHFDDKRNDLDADLTEENIRTHVVKNSLPWVMEFTEENAQKIFGGDATQHMILFGDKANDEMKAVAECYTETAKKYLGKLMFVIIDTSREENANVVQFFGIKPDEKAAVRIVNLDEDMKKYAPSGATGCELFPSFAEDYLAGKIEPYKMTEEIPDDWDKEPVKVLVGKNFNEVAKQKDKFVFVEFYAPWCGHCQALAPTWEELGKHYESTDDVIIAKMDSTANEVDGVEIQGFPTLKMFVNNDKDEVLDYEGARDFDAIKTWIEAVKKGERPTFDHGHDHEHGDHDHEHGGEPEGAPVELDIEGEEQPEAHDEL